MPEISIGRVVIYKTTEDDRKSLKGAYGNQSTELPAVVVAVWNSTLVNLKVITDAPVDIWKTSISQGDNEGQWNWPVIKKD
ncbi:MAG: hypothetical protein HOP30_21730 [Cyclobacteriaceae bacterium]|nr:hypothetical protein [Cyclobacteriaceae bacterium]